MTQAGFPPTRVLGEAFLVTTEPEATTELSPTITPPIIIAPAAIQRVGWVKTQLKILIKSRYLCFVATKPTRYVVVSM